MLPRLMILIRQIVLFLKWMAKILMVARLKLTKHKNANVAAAAAAADTAAAVAAIATKTV